MIHRGRSGFGFSISGQSPVTVCRVDDGSLAALGGLRVGDVLLAVDGRNVVGAASETVAALVRSVFKRRHLLLFLLLAYYFRFFLFNWPICDAGFDEKVSIRRAAGTKKSVHM